MDGKASVYGVGTSRHGGGVRESNRMVLVVDERVPDIGLACQGHGRESIRGDMRGVKDTATGSNGAAE